MSGAFARAVAKGAPPLDIADCASEPIRIPGGIQPHGALFVIDPASGEVLQAAIGDPAALRPGEAPLGRRLHDVLVPEAAALLGDLEARLPAKGTTHLGVVRTGDSVHHLIAHRADGAVIVELERASAGEPGTFDQVYPHVRDFLQGLQGAASMDALTALAAREVRRITGLDRAMIYEFDANWNGAVIAEARNEELPSYLGLRFPASDIPAQARELYRLNRLRLIADAGYTPAALVPVLNPRTGEPADLSYSVLRSVSPVHLEYMRNMGTMASMSISLMRGDQLWGLISCHNRLPLQVGYHVRAACDFIGQILSLEIASRQSAALAEERARLHAVQTRLLSNMAGAAWFGEGLLARGDDLLALTGATGAAIVTRDGCALVGDTPGTDGVARLVAWLAERGRGEVFATECLADEMPGGEALKDEASGVLAASISQLHDSYVLWFRPEVIRTVTWGGDPHKRARPDAAGGRLHPRKSFESWRETVRLRAEPWDVAQIDAASNLRSAIVDIVLRKAEEMADLTERVVSVNKELEAFSYSVSHDLRAPFRHIVGYAQLLKKNEGATFTPRADRYIETIIESAVTAGALVDDLLSFSQMGRATLRPIDADMEVLVAEVRRAAMLHQNPARVRWSVGDLPRVQADPTMLRLVWQNLIENALKFTRDRETALIEIGADEDKTETRFWVRDNGTGFDMAYVGKLFGVFQRLHRVEDFEGTGIGLANVKRIVERHGGRVWAEGQVGQGALFGFALPREGAR